MKPDRRSLVLGFPAVLVASAYADVCAAQTATSRPVGDDASKPSKLTVLDREVVDPQTKRRILMRVRLPESPLPSPLILYSPGLGSGLSNGASWCNAWQRAGFVVVTLAHPGTDDAIWNTTKRSLRANLSDALAPPQYGQRVQDCEFAIGKCLAGLGFEGRIDPLRIGIAGHSFGALTVQALASRVGRGTSKLPIGAAIALSPGARSKETLQAVSVIRMPFFCVTGDHDSYVTFGRGADAMRLGMPIEQRLSVYRHLPTGNRQLLVLARADHMTFAGEAVSSARFSRDVPVPDNENDATWTRVNLATTAFWNRYLSAVPRVDRASYIEQVRSQLDPADRLEVS